MGQEHQEHHHKNHQHAHMFSVIILLVATLAVIMVLLMWNSQAQGQAGECEECPKPVSGTYTNTTMTLTFDQLVYATGTPHFLPGGVRSRSPLRFWEGGVSSVSIAKTAATASKTVTVNLSSPVPSGTRDVYLSYNLGSIDANKIRNTSGVNVKTFAFRGMVYTGSSEDAPTPEARCGTTLNTCAAGTLQDDADGPSRYGWTCKDAQDSGRDKKCFLPKSTCTAETKNNCDIPEGGPGTTDGSCSSGYIGECLYWCDDGTWEELDNICALPVSTEPCVPEVIDNCSMTITTSQGNILQGVCASGYEGDCSYRCADEGAWEQVANTCEEYVPDTEAPILTLVTPVLSDITDRDEPTFTFSSSEDGTFPENALHACPLHSSNFVTRRREGKPWVEEGNNTYRIRAREVGTHTCSITVLDGSGNESQPLEFSYTVTAYNENTPPVLTEVTPITSPAPNSPTYVFRSSKKARLAYGGDCATGLRDFYAPRVAYPNSDTTVRFRGLPPYTTDSSGIDVVRDEDEDPVPKEYTNCTITATDDFDNTATLTIGSFTVDWSPVLTDFFPSDIIDNLSEDLKTRMTQLLKETNGSTKRRIEVNGQTVTTRWNLILNEISGVMQDIVWFEVPSVISAVLQTDTEVIKVRLSRSVVAENNPFGRLATGTGNFRHDFEVLLSDSSTMSPTKVTIEGSIITVQLAEGISSDVTATLTYTQDSTDRICVVTGQTTNTDGDLEESFTCLESFSSQPILRGQTIMRNPNIGTNTQLQQQVVDNPGAVIVRDSPDDVSEDSPEANQAYTITQTYTSGDVADEIRYAQILLNRSENCKVAESGPGSPGNETNVFGTKTRNAILCYQREQELTETGTLTPQLYGSLVANYWIRQQ